MEGLQQALLPAAHPDGMPLIGRPDFPTEPGESREGLRVSEAEYWRTWYNEPDFHYEWCNGHLEVKPVSDYLGYQMARWFLFLLHAFLNTHPIGRDVGLDIGFRLAFGDHVSVRRPDFAVILNSNPVAINDRDASYRGLYDICIEVLSYTSRKAVLRDTDQKKEEYAGAGVQEYYILDARGIETAFYQLGPHQIYQHIQPVRGDVIRSSVLPGFQFRNRDLHTRPELETLMRHSVYQHYVLPGWRQAEKRASESEAMRELEKQRADRAEQRVEWEKQRAEQEKQRADRADQRTEILAERLKELGVSLDDVA